MSGWDFIYDFLPNLWRHPETGVVIRDEDMPNELLPLTEADR